MKNSFFSHSIAPRMIFSVLLVILLLLLIPMFAIARYDVPAADDFSFSCETHAAIVSRGSVTDILSGAVEKAVKVYYTWQGSFSAIFLMALQPAIWGLPYYAFTTWIMLLSLLGGLFFRYISCDAPGAANVTVLVDQGIDRSGKPYRFDGGALAGKLEVLFEIQNGSLLFHDTVFKLGMCQSFFRCDEIVEFFTPDLIRCLITEKARKRRRAEHIAVFFVFEADGIIDLVEKYAEKHLLRKVLEKIL